MLDEATIDTLIGQALAGNHEAYGDLVVGIHDDLRVFVAVRCGTPDLIEEVVQAALITAWKSLARYEGRGSFVSWVKGIALNHLRHALRDRARAHIRDIPALSAVHDLVALERAEPTDDLRLDRLRHCLERLSSRVRHLIDLRYRDGLDLEAVAQRVGRPAGTLAVQFHRLRKTLRTCIESPDAAGDPA